MQYLNKGMSFDVDILHADTHWILLQVDNIIYNMFDQECQN